MLKRPYDIVLSGTSFRTAPLELRERLSRSVSLESLQTFLEGKRPNESFGLISTCNRIEIYACTVDATSTLTGLTDYLTRLEPDVNGSLYYLSDGEAIEHIIRVACGLDSMVIGEPQVLLQVKHAETFTHTGSGQVLEKFIHHAYTSGSRIRKDVGIDAGYSIGSAAADLILSKHNHKPDLLILGGGKMALSTVKELKREKFGEIHIANRTPAKAYTAAFEGIHIHPLTEAKKLLARVDAAIIATSSPDYVVTKDTMSRWKNNRQILLVDISIPRNVDPTLGRDPNIELYNIDDLIPYTKTRLNHEQNNRANQLIHEEARRFSLELSALEVAPVIRSVRARAEKIGREETERALRRLSGVKERDAEVLSALSSHIVNRLLHEPTARIREHAMNGDGEEYARVFRDLFGIDD